MQKSSTIDVRLGCEYTCLCIATPFSGFSLLSYTLSAILTSQSFIQGFCKIFVPTVVSNRNWGFHNYYLQDQLMKTMAQNRQNPGIITETIPRKNETVQGNSWWRRCYPILSKHNWCSERLRLDANPELAIKQPQRVFCSNRSHCNHQFTISIFVGKFSV